MSGFNTIKNPFLHYISVGKSLPIDLANEIKSLSSPANLVSKSGSRADYDQRLFLTKKNSSKYSDLLNDYLEYLNSDDFMNYSKNHFNLDLSNARLRAEVVSDIDGFFQVPHTDVGEKRITWLTYLGTIEENGDVGTDIYNKDLEIVSSAPWGFNNGLIFVPGPDTFHGFSKNKKIKGDRVVLIINYVDSWRDTHELYN
jgi:hypothetical protein